MICLYCYRWCRFMDICGRWESFGIARRCHRGSSAPRVDYGSIRGLPKHGGRDEFPLPRPSTRRTLRLPLSGRGRLLLRVLRRAAADRLQAADVELKTEATAAPGWSQHRLLSKAEGVRLALSYVEEALR